MSQRGDLGHVAVLVADEVLVIRISCDSHLHIHLLGARRTPNKREFSTLPDVGRVNEAEGDHGAVAVGVNTAARDANHLPCFVEYLVGAILVALVSKVVNKAAVSGVGDVLHVVPCGVHRREHPTDGLGIPLERAYVARLVCGNLLERLAAHEVVIELDEKTETGVIRRDKSGLKVIAHRSVEPAPHVV